MSKSTIGNVSLPALNEYNSYWVLARNTFISFVCANE